MAIKISEKSTYCYTSVKCLLSSSGEFLYVEKEIEDLLGYAPVSLIGESVVNFLHPGEQELFRSCCESIHPKPVLARLRSFANSYEWFELSLEPSIDTYGRVCSYLTQIRRLEKEKGSVSQGLQDFTYRNQKPEKETEKSSVVESDKLYRSLFENHPDLVLVTDPQGVILNTNKNLLGYNLCMNKDLVGQNSLSFLAEEGRRKVSSKLPDLLLGHTVQLEVKVCYASIPFSALITFVPFEEEGTITGFFIQLRDITERIKTEEALQLSNERYQLASKATRDAVLDWDLSTNLMYLGDGYQTLFGHQLPSSITVDQWIKFIHPDDSKKVIEALFDRISSNEKWSIEYRYKCSDGTYKHIRDRAYVIYNGNKRAIRITGAMSDISEHKKAEELLKSFNAELEEKVNEKTFKLESAVSRMKEEIRARIETDKILQQSLIEKEVLLKEIHHRVKNNMAVISGLLSLQARQTTISEVKELFKESQSRIKSMALIHEHLYQHQNLSSINFNRYVQELVRGISQAHNYQNRIELQVIAEDIELDINHAAPCGLILNELIINSFKYAFTGKKRGVIRVSFRKQEKYCELSVSDNGSGLPETLNLSTPKTLGLRLIQNLVKQLGGTMKVRNQMGAEFTILFPVKS